MESVTTMLKSSRPCARVCVCVRMCVSLKASVSCSVGVGVTREGHGCL